MTDTNVMPFDNLYKIIRTLEHEYPEVAEEIINDAKKLAQVVGNDIDALAKLVSECNVEITRYLDKKTLDSVNDVLSGEVK